MSLLPEVVCLFAGPCTTLFTTDTQHFPFQFTQSNFLHSMDVCLFLRLIFAMVFLELDANLGGLPILSHHSSPFQLLFSRLTCVSCLIICQFQWSTTSLKGQQLAWIHWSSLNELLCVHSKHSVRLIVNTKHFHFYTFCLQLFVIQCNSSYAHQETVVHKTLPGDSLRSSICLLP